MDSSTKRPKPNIRGRSSDRSFRSRLSWSVVLLVVFAVASTTIYTLFRTDRTNTYLSNQISESVQKQTEKELTSIVSRHTTDLDNFFLSVSKNMETLGATIQLLLKSYSISGASGSWEANLNLTRLPQGSWDNPNNEAGIHIRARAGTITRFTHFRTQQSQTA